MVFFIAIAIAAFVAMLVEMLTYTIGDGGAITRFYRKYKTTNVDVVLGFLLASMMIWKGSTPVMVIGVIVYVAVIAIALIRLDRRII